MPSWRGPTLPQKERQASVVARLLVLLHPRHACRSTRAVHAYQLLCLHLTPRRFFCFVQRGKQHEVHRPKSRMIELRLRDWPECHHMHRCGGRDRPNGNSPRRGSTVHRTSVVRPVQSQQQQGHPIAQAQWEGPPMRAWCVGGCGQKPGLVYAASPRLARYSMAQNREIHEALEKITRPATGWNKSLQALKAEHASRKARRVE